MSIYEPREDSFLLEKQVKKYVKNKKVLDMCTGSGIIALACKEAKAKSVLAVDVNEDAVNLCLSKGLNAIKSNMFAKIDKKEKFDVITCNPPYLPFDERENADSALATTGGKNGDEFICEFIKQAINYIAKNGKILLLVSSLTPKEKFNSILKKMNMKCKIIASEKLSFEELSVIVIEQ